MNDTKRCGACAACRRKNGSQCSAPVPCAPRAANGSSGRRPEKKRVDAGRPLADVFEAVASAQETDLVPVLRAPSRTIAEAASDIKKLVAPSDLPPQTRERLKSSQRGAGRRFGCFDGDRAAATLLSEIDYERCLREFENVFEKHHLADFWLAVETRLATALEQAEHEGAMPHVIRLDCGEGKGAVAIAPPPEGRLRRALEKPDNTPEARDDLEPTNPGAYHVNTLAGGFGFASFRSIDGLAQRGKALASDAFTRCVALDTRVRVGSELEAYCETLAATARVETVCPPREGWTFGPRGRSMAGDADRRYYLIAGWAGGLTPTHCALTCVGIKRIDGVGTTSCRRRGRLKFNLISTQDFGTQAVVYHHVSGQNRVLGVPRPVANCLHAAREALSAEDVHGDAADARLLRFEADALLGCLNRGLLQYDEFGPGETMLILPRGGHAVLTGRPHKVVLAGEWHLTPDGVRAAAVPASLTSPRPFAEEEAAPDPAAIREAYAREQAQAPRAAPEKESEPDPDDETLDDLRAKAAASQEEAAPPTPMPPAAKKKAPTAVTTEPLVAGALEAPTTPAPAATTPFRPPTQSDINDPTTPAAPAAGRRRRTRPVPGTLPAVTPLPAPKKRAPPPAVDVDDPPRRKKPCFGASVETLEAVESRFLGATLPLQ